jgi:transposase
LKNARERMDVIAAYRDVGSYRGAAAICGTTHKTVKRIVEQHEASSAGSVSVERIQRARNFDDVTDLVAEKVEKTSGRISAKRLLPVARAAGYVGSPRNFRRLVADAKAGWRQGNPGGRRPGVWTPGETLIIDWGVQGGLHVFCAVLAWSRFRFVRFATDEKASTTLGLLAECFEVLGGVPKVVLADRMGCLKGGVVANVVVPTPDYVRFAAHYRFRPDFCEAADPESKGMVENLVGYAKDDLMVPLQLRDEPVRGLGVVPGADLARVNAAAGVWCAEVNAVVHSEICAIPSQRLETERGLLGQLPSLRPEIGARPTTRKVDKLSCIRFASGRYSVPNRLIGNTVTVLVDERAKLLRIAEPVTGEILAEHVLVPPGETSIVDDHYGGPRPDTPRRAARPRTPSEKAFLGLGPVAEAFLTGAAAAGVTKLTTEIGEILTLQAAHGTDPLLAALERAVAFSRWRAADVRSILATNGQAPVPRPAGQALVLTLPTVPTRSLDAYRIDQGGGDPA